MSKTITITTAEGKTYQFVDDGSPMQGGMKDVYFAPDKSYVVAFFRDKQDFNSKERLNKIVTIYRKGIFENVGGEYWKDLFCWPYDIVDYNGKVGIIVPSYQKQFFFKHGALAGKEKEGKWFSTAQFFSNKYPLKLDKAEIGDWMRYFIVCIKISRAVKRLHAAGLAHSDLSYKNVLVDPVSGTASIIDIDGLVVPGVFPPDVIGTPDFIAPEVIETKHLAKTDPNRKLPNINTDKYALAVMVYMYLLKRHPLRGGKVNFVGDDPNKDEDLSMGEKAIFIEHPTDKSNSNPKKLFNSQPQKLPYYEPWIDLNKLPYTICGPYLSSLFEKAFIQGLHNPLLRPTANEWEDALVKTVDLMQPCQNTSCEQKWYVFASTTKPSCPFCGTEYKGQLPILNLFYRFKADNWKTDNHRLMVYHNQYLYQWHVNRLITANERLTAAQKKPVGYFVFHNNKWQLVNQTLTSLKDVTEDKEIPIGKSVVLTDGKKILLSKDEGGRLLIVQLVNN